MKHIGYTNMLITQFLWTRCCRVRIIKRKHKSDCKYVSNKVKRQTSQKESLQWLAKSEQRRSSQSILHEKTSIRLSFHQGIDERKVGYLKFYSKIRNYFTNLIIISRLYSPLRARTYQSTACLTSTCSHKDVKDHSAGLGVTLVSPSTPQSFWLQFRGDVVSTSRPQSLLAF